MTTPRPNALRELVQRRLADEGLSYADVARRGGIPKATVASLAVKDLTQVPRPETILGLARGLGLPLGMVQAAIAAAVGLLPEDEDDDATRTVRYALPELPADKRQEIAALVGAMLRSTSRK